MIALAVILALSPGRPSMPAPPAAPDSLPTFEADVKPVLVKSCSPCHFTGGRMYEKLPFDDPKVLASHVPGVTKRLKGTDLETYQSWLRTLPETKSSAR